MPAWGAESKKPFILADRVTVPASGQVTADMQGNQAEAVWVDSLQLYLEETGTAAKNRGILVQVAGGGGKNWMASKIPAHMCMPDRNAAASIFTIPGGGQLLKPNQGFDFELLDDGTGRTVFIGMIGYIRDRR